MPFALHASARPPAARDLGTLPRWILASAVFLTLVAAMAPAEHVVGALLAALNILLAAALARGAWKRYGIAAAPVLAFLPGFAISWPLTTIYFAAFYPDAGYETLHKSVRCLELAAGIQCCLLLFLVGYWGGLSLPPAQSPLARATPVKEPLDRESPLDWPLVFWGLIAVTAGWGVFLGGQSAAVALVGNGLRNYFTGLLVIAGLRWSAWGRLRRILVLAVLAASGLVNTLANARGLAAWPVLMLVFGYLLSPRASRRWKTGLVITVTLLFPLYIVFGNQTRKSNMRVGFNDLGVRAQVLQDALTTGDLQYDTTGPVSDLMGRLFSAGGHTLISENWDRTERLEFDGALFLQELVRAQVPGFLKDSGSDGHYLGNSILRDYGFVIDESTSVETSLIGALFVCFGLPSVLLGGLLLGAIHGSIAAWASSERRVGSAARLAVLAGISSVNAWGYNVDFIGNLRGIIWEALYVSAAYALVWCIGRVLQAGTAHAPGALARPTTSQ
jgi:hypothetical protein